MTEWTSSFGDQYSFRPSDFNQRRLCIRFQKTVGDFYELYLDESRPELYEKQDLRRPRR